ncbi:MAG: hypothetical protein ABI723_08350 [Bacteroidia bacterium]
MQEKDFFDILFYLAAPVLVLATSYFLITKFFDRDYRMQLFELKRAAQQYIIPLRLQAYERIILFLERLQLNNLIMRVREDEMNVRQFQLALIQTVRAEMDHNLTQQIYLSSSTWNMIKTTREETVRIINFTADTLSPNAPATDLAKALFEYIINNDFISTQHAIDAVKDEARQMF